MKIYIADNSGFCFGVKSAVQKTIEVAESDQKAYTYGELIHNQQVIDMLSEMNVNVVDDIMDADNKKIIIRSHGVEPKVYEDAKNAMIEVIDATCPFVKKIHDIVSSCYEKGYQIIIVGCPDHPEVMGINGWARNTAIILDSVQKIDESIIESIKLKRKACVVAQTTITKALWDGVANSLKTIFSEDIKNNQIELSFKNTICSATTKRQDSTKELSKIVDLMIVIGGKNSSNTQKLLNISKEFCKNTLYIQTSSDIMMKDVKKYDRIGVTAGASTPDWVIDEVVEKLINEGGVIING